MIDFHSHILEGLDDGVVSFEEALAVVKEDLQRLYRQHIISLKKNMWLMRM